MKNPLKKCLLYFSAFVLIALASSSASADYVHITSDSTANVNRTWHKLTHQINRFTHVVNAYVKAVVKAKPADTTITTEVVTYSKAMDTAIRSAGPKDSVSVKTVESLFDSLVQASVRLVKKVETDSAFINNKAVKQLSSAMSNIREGVNKYQKDLNDSAARRREKKQASGTSLETN